MKVAAKSHFVELLKDHSEHQNTSSEKEKDTSAIRLARTRVP